MLALAVAGAFVASRAGVPLLVAFLALGMLLGSDGPGGIEFDDPGLARDIGVVGLIAILFEGGLTTAWRGIRPVLVPAAVLSTFGVAVTALVTGLAAYVVFDLRFETALILGAVVGSTDAAAVFATLRFTRLRRRLARLLEAESGLNDPMAVALTVGLIGIVDRPAYGKDDLLVEIARQLGLGVVVGVLLGAIAAWAFRRLPGTVAPFAPVASVAAAAIGYGAADAVGGSGFLAVYVVALALGNTRSPFRRSIVAFHQGLAFLAQVALFVTLGLLVFPHELPPVAGAGLVVAAVLVFVARPAAVWLSTLGQGFGRRERALLGWAGLRGAVPIVLATIAQSEGVAASDTVFNAVFFVVLVSALVQGPTLEPLARRLGLALRRTAPHRPPIEVDAVGALEVVEHVVAPGDRIAGLHVRDLELPRDSALVAVIVRAEETIAPRGSTVVEPGDRLYVLALRPAGPELAAAMRGWR